MNLASVLEKARIIPPSGPSLLAREIQRETLRSEKLRVTILSACFVLASLYSMVVHGMSMGRFPDLPVTLSLPPHHYLAFFFGACAVYELLVGRVFAFFLNREVPFPSKALYGNALMETSLPTVGILALAKAVSVHALFTPAVYIYFIFIILSALRLNPLLCLFTGFVAGGGYLAAGFSILGAPSSHGPLDYVLTDYSLLFSRAALLMLGGAVAAFVAARIRTQIVRSLELVEEKNRIANLFGQHVSPQVAESLLDAAQNMTGQVRPVCIMFLDIRRFTAFADKRSPAQVVEYLNQVFGFMIDIVNANHGIINKFLGDGFMAVFGAPLSHGNDCQNAVQASLEIVQRMEMEIQAGALPETRVGIGLHAGLAVAGAIGSHDRKEYTVIGGVVNLASRIEQLNKDHDSRVLVSRDVWEQVKDAVQFQESYPEVRIRGMDRPVDLFRLA